MMENLMKAIVACDWTRIASCIVPAPQITNSFTLENLPRNGLSKFEMLLAVYCIFRHFKLGKFIFPPGVLGSNLIVTPTCNCGHQVIAV